MSERDVFEELSAFFDGIPDAVRTEISLLLMVLAGDQSVDTEGWADCERTARGLFNAQGRYGRFGDLIKAVGVFDVYFAADAGERFTSASSRPQLRRASGGDDQTDGLRGRYANRLAAIDKAGRDWQILRQTSLAPSAISAALMPQVAPGSKQRPRSNPVRSAHQGHVNQQAGM